ncbi:MAG: hypothetical protein NPMRD1_400002 [Nitrosopumilales archaeon]|nr:MAG: hypothetical protein NPMRD1_400002 [Nitrosopumilales archaeon]
MTINENYNENCNKTEGISSFRRHAGSHDECLISFSEVLNEALRGKLKS